MNVRHNERIARRRNVPRDAFTQLNAQIGDVLGVDACVQGVVEFTRLFVEHEQRPLFRAEVLFHLAQDGAQQRLKFEVRGKRSRNLVKDAQVVELSVVHRLGVAPICHVPSYLAGKTVLC